ncbi:MAG: hypothetical protein IT548_10110 [Alphaproteobacteria bacterium]|nr:hypothetical protein [Alphaproteobacteria bacterium]
MGLHIYAGSLVRLFTNDWENEVQRASRERGFTYQTNYQGGEPSWPTPAKAAEHVAWMRETLVATPDVGPGAVDWRDDTNDYHTIKLHEEGRDAIAIISAHLRRPDLPMPSRMPVSAADDLAYAEAGAKGYLMDAVAPFDATLIIPGTFARISLIQDPLGEMRIVCSTALLQASLDAVKQGFWAGAVEPDVWRNRGLVYARSGGTRSADGTWLPEPEPPDSLRGNAEFAFGVYTSMLAFSQHHHAAIAMW